MISWFTGCRCNVYVFFLFPQHFVSVLPCRGGSALPLHLAAYVHPRAPPLHARYRVHPHPLYSRPPLQFPAPTQRAAHRRGEITSRGLWASLRSPQEMMSFSPSLPLPVGPGGWPRQQPPTTTGRISTALTCVMALPGVVQIQFCWGYLHLRLFRP